MILSPPLCLGTHFFSLSLGPEMQSIVHIDYGAVYVVNKPQVQLLRVKLLVTLKTKDFSVQELSCTGVLYVELEPCSLVRVSSCLTPSPQLLPSLQL